MADELVRSEKISLASIPEVLSAIKKTKNHDELAMLLMMATQLFADSSCRCEEKAAVYGNDSEEAMTCERSVADTQQKIYATYRELVASIAGG